MSSLISCEHLGGVHFSVSVRGHSFSVDMPAEGGGEDQGPTPPEMFVASLGTCIGVFIARYCRNKGIPYEGFSVDLTFELADDPYRIKSITGDITMPEGLPAARQAAILNVARTCLVHTTLHNTPEIDIQLAEG